MPQKSMNMRKQNTLHTVEWCNYCDMKGMAGYELKERMEHIKAQINAAEETYSSAINAKEDYHTLKSIRSDITNLKKELQELQEAYNPNSKMFFA